jgi:hypothetical protein
MSEHEDLQLRFTLVRELMEMPYGYARKLDGRMVRRAWKPTGDYDRSFEAGFRAMALASGGHRPETSYTTDERITNDLDGSFKWHERLEDGDYVFHRRNDACPKCKGRLSVRTIERVELPTEWAADIDAGAHAIATSWEPCDKHGNPA